MIILPMMGFGAMKGPHGFKMIHKWTHAGSAAKVRGMQLV
jgi:hypothetical protein